MLELDFSSFPTLETQRLRLRELQESDAEDIHAMRSDESVMQFIGRARSTSSNDARELIERIQNEKTNTEAITWGITIKPDETLIGTIGLYRLKKEHFRGEIGYLLAKPFWGNGYMSESVVRVLKHAFESLGFHSIEADINPANSASKRVLDRAGFKLEGQLKESFYFDGKFYDSHIYSILAADFAKTTHP